MLEFHILSQNKKGKEKKRNKTYSLCFLKEDTSYQVIEIPSLNNLSKVMQGKGGTSSRSTQLKNHLMVDNIMEFYHIMTWVANNICCLRIVLSRLAFSLHVMAKNISSITLKRK